jgi:predicted acylesterase/phospholipase RssA
MYRRIYLCGGGMNGICNIGVLQELEERRYLPFIKEWIGISSGSLQAIIFASGYTIAQAFEILKMDFQQITEPDFAPGWLLNFGYDTGNRLLKFLFALLKERGLKELITFRELFETTGNSFRTFATDMNAATLVEFSKEKTPDYPIAYASRASMSLPYYFQPFKCPLKGTLYSDGGVITNFPLYCIPEEERQEILAINIPIPPNANNAMELQEFLIRPLQIFLAARTEVDGMRYPSQTIIVPGVTSSPTDFGMSLEDKMELVAKGKKAAKAFFKKYMRPVRRYSVS